MRKQHFALIVIKCQCESTEGGKKGQEAQSKHRPFPSLTTLFGFQDFSSSCSPKYSTHQLFKSRKPWSASTAPFLEALSMGEVGGKEGLFPCDRAVNGAAVCNITAWQTSSCLTAFPFGFALHFPALESQSKNFPGAGVLLWMGMKGAMLQQNSYQPEGNYRWLLGAIATVVLETKAGEGKWVIVRGGDALRRPMGRSDSHERGFPVSCKTHKLFMFC